LSIVYGLFNKNMGNILASLLAIIVIYIVIMAYAGGVMAIEKGADND